MAQAAPITKDHLPLLLQAAAESRYPTRDRALVLILAELGPRPCELANLTWKSLVDASGALTGRMVWKTRKKGEVRDEELSKPTLAAVAELHKRFKIQNINKSVFLTQRRGAFKEQSMRSHIISLAQSVGLSASAYSVRHWVFDAEAKAVTANGGTGRNLMSFTGHRSLSSVQHYLDRHSTAMAEIRNSRHSRMSAF